MAPDRGRHRAAAETGEVFRLVFVCTGNICRSPFAEILTRHLLVGRLGGGLASRFDVSSAGVSAVVGGAMHPDSRHELEPWGLHGAAAERFVARQLRSPMVADAHLVLGANTRHRSTVVERSPEGLPKTFSMLEFARLARAVDADELPDQPVARAHALVELARGKRGLVPPVDPVEDIVPDPMGGTAEDHHRAATLIRSAVSTIVDIIAPARPPVGPVRPAAVPEPAPRSRNTVSDEPPARRVG